jgi:hypothetical protein
MNARFERVAWSTQLNAEEMQGLQDLVLAQGWLETGLSSTKTPPNARCQIDLRLADESLQKTIKGQHPRIEPVRLALRDIANRRLKPDLERQPRPSLATQPVTTAPAATRPP